MNYEEFLKLMTEHTVREERSVAAKDFRNDFFLTYNSDNVCFT